MTGSRKARVRERIRAQRRVRNEQSVAVSLLRQLERVQPTTTRRGGARAIYLDMSSEPPTDAVIAAWGSARLPRTCVDAAGQPSLEWVDYHPGDALQVSPIGVREPVGDPIGVGGTGVADCDVIVVPALAIDTRGHRLGQGGGYYDRVLAQLPAADRPLVVAFVFDDEILDDVGAESHDIRVDAAITPSRVVRFTA